MSEPKKVLLYLGSMLFCFLVQLPLMLAGIVAGFVVGERIQRTLGLSSSWAGILFDLGLAMMGVYIGALLAYVFLLLFVAAIFGREALAGFDTPSSPFRKPLWRPFHLVAQAIIVRSR